MKKTRRRAYSPVRIDRHPAVELPDYLQTRWERVVQGLATEIAWQEENGPKFRDWNQVIAEACWQLGRVSFFSGEEEREENPDKGRAADSIHMYLKSLCALCIRWWAHHEASREGR